MTVLFESWSGPAVINAAGTVKTVDQARELVRAPVPAILLGSYTLEERAGNEGRTFHEFASGALNSMGLPSPGLAIWSGWVRALVSDCHADGKEVWVSVAGFDPKEYRILAEAALDAGADAVELNFGCPNVWDRGRQKPIVSFCPELMGLVLSDVATLGHARIGVKLSALLDPALLDSVAALVAANQVGFVTCINTIPNCFAHEGSGTSAITAGNGFGGLSGPAVKPIGLGQVKAHRDRLPGVPIVGVGGVSTGDDLAEYLHPRVGADAAQIGTAFLQRGPRIFAEVLQEYVESDLAA